MEKQCKGEQKGNTEIMPWASIPLEPIAIVHESLMLLWIHAKLLLCIQLALFPTSMIAALLTELLIHRYGLHGLPFASRGGGEHPSHVSYAQHRSSISTVHDPLKLMSLWLAVDNIHFFVNMAIEALLMAATLYVVGLGYAEKSVSSLEIVRAMPRLWRRLALTELLTTVVVYAIAVVSLLVVLELDRRWTLLGVLVLAPSAIYFAIISHLARFVSVFEERYGWAAFEKGICLLQGRHWVVCLILSFWAVPLVWLDVLVHRHLNTTAPWSAGSLLVVAAFYLSKLLILQLGFLSGGVLYMSLKRYHHDTIVDSIFHFQDTNDERCELEGIEYTTTLPQQTCPV